jgi:hypothetical protein
MVKLTGAGACLLLIVAACSGSRSYPPHARANANRADDEDGGALVVTRDAGAADAAPAPPQRL